MKEDKIAELAHEIDSLESAKRSLSEYMFNLIVNAHLYTTMDDLVKRVGKDNFKLEHSLVIYKSKNTGNITLEQFTDVEVKDGKLYASIMNGYACLKLEPNDNGEYQINYGNDDIVEVIGICNFNLNKGINPIVKE